MVQIDSKRLTSVVDNSVKGTYWKRFKEFGSQNQMVFSVGHFSPEIKMDKTLVGGGLISGGPAPTMATGVKYNKDMVRGNLKDFYTSMKSMAEAGWLPGYTTEMIEKMRVEKNKTHPEEFDMVADIGITGFDSEETAGQALINQKQTAEGNFFEAQIPGAPTGMNIFKAMDSKEMQANLSKEQLAQFEKLKPKIKEAEAKIKSDREKIDMSNNVAKLFGYDALITTTGNKKFNMAIRVKNFLIVGSFIYSFEMLPDGNTPCESVSQFSSKKITERVEGKTYERTEVSPKQSTLGAEGFLNKTEIEQILKDIFKQL
jgi:hypothetical protein